MWPLGGSSGQPRSSGGRRRAPWRQRGAMASGAVGSGESSLFTQGLKGRVELGQQRNESGAPQAAGQKEPRRTGVAASVRPRAASV